MNVDTGRHRPQDTPDSLWWDDERARITRELERAFPGVQVWYGEHTKTWCAWDRTGPMLQALTPQQLAEQITRVRQTRPHIAHQAAAHPSVLQPNPPRRHR
ncbi:hypothetical protein Acsp04_62890 [Actinomadura sp. NBRC 104425]|uniref:hypothetical protein n=1 Tax=Actinomadura sp. NBRC 104425 TaxID=3032204 RepID=UPI0024A1AD05|nr:hypothetical protein [Actinomadura sp. NBRC 104425]GLZ16054.1 hypothetical protein Acsp04_62890 [Actinomadura sp. NBRC 104425]